MLNITKGRIDRAQKTVIYGPEGIGKTSLAARHPDPVIIDTEGRRDQRGHHGSRFPGGEHLRRYRHSRSRRHEEPRGIF